MSEIGNVYVFDSADMPVSDLQVIHSPGTRSLEDECLGFCDSEFRSAVAEKIKKINKPGSGQHDGNLLCFNGFTINEDDTRTLELCDIDFSTFQTLYDRLNLEVGQEHTLTRTVPMIGIAETSDGNFVLGHRNTEWLPDRYLPPAGFTDRKDRDEVIGSKYFAWLTKKEVEEEIAVEITEDSVRYVGLTAGDDSRNNTVILYTKLPTDTAETEDLFQRNNQRLDEKGGKIEHLHLLYLPNDLDSVTEFLCGRYSGNLNPINEINFDNGRCIRGPKEILGKSYKQIGNGIGAILSLMQQRITGTNYVNLVNDILDSGVVDGIEHMDINEKLGVI